MNERTLRPWARITSTIISTAIGVIAVVWGYALVIEAMTGINLIDVVGRMIG